MASRTPFELRFDMIQLAMTQLRDEYHAAHERHTSYQHNQHTPFERNYPTLEDALNLADKMREWVNDRRLE